MSSGGNRKGGGGGSSGAAGNGFKPLGLSEDVYKAIVRIGFRQPTPVQRKALPVILTGTDACVMARTGSGKTAAFLIPLLEKLIANERPLNGGTRALVLSPTRELSLQTLKVLQKLAHFTDIRAIGIHGGEGMEKQFDQLASKPDVIVATPGRLSHHLTEIPDFDLKGCQICILDEADRLIEMGFSMQIRQIARTLPEHCQKVMLSATMPKLLVEFTKGGFSTDPAVIRLDQEASVSEDLRISFINCRSLDKDAALMHIVSNIQTDQTQNESTRTGLTLIFCATRHHVEYVTALLCASGQKATLVYGTLDQEARKSNIAAFRQGHKPILVVTDVAARGIDIPLIDHVIHYHFPPSAKLFVHRSGRAARAGRIGFCWGLVEPDELPFMVDLHLFLGRRPTTAEMAHEQREDDDDSDEYTYTLAEMTPEMVHYGSIPESIMTHEVENVRRIMDSELSGSEASEAMKSLLKVCSNAMKQYRRTRPEASLQGARRARAILEGQKSETGERTGGGTICSHPLLRGMELTYYQEQKEQGKIGNLNNLENQKKREEFLRAMSQFRPKETVFEAFATGGGKDLGIIGQVDKGRTTSTKRDNSSYALSAMRNMRRQMRIVRDKGTSLVVAGTSTAQVLNGDGEVADDENHGEAEESEQATSTKKSLSAKVKVSAPLPDAKRRLSRAERRQLKKNPNEPVAPSSARNAGDKPKKAMRGSDFRDTAFFIEHDISANTEEAQRRRHVERAMQPSASTTNKGAIGTALRMEEAMMDIVGDENDELVQKQRMMRWDKSKRKYVQTTVGAELSGDSFSKRMKLESGQKVKTDKLKLGEVYEKWQKKTNRSIGRTGVFDDAPTGGDDDVIPAGRSGRRGGKSAKKGPNGEKQKTAEEIKKGRDETSNMKMKNMKKGDRRHAEQQNKKSQGGDKVEPKKGSQGKRGSSGRWGVVQKNRKHSS